MPGSRGFPVSERAVTEPLLSLVKFYHRETFKCSFLHYIHHKEVYELPDLSRKILEKFECTL